MRDNIPGFTIHTDKHIGPDELANLFSSVGWGDEADTRGEINGRAYLQSTNGY